MIVLGSLVMALGFVVYYGMTTSSMGIYFVLAACPEGRPLPIATASRRLRHLIWFNVGMLVGVIARGFGREPLGRDRSRWSCRRSLMILAMPVYVGVVAGSAGGRRVSSAARSASATRG